MSTEKEMMTNVDTYTNNTDIRNNNKNGEYDEIIQLIKNCEYRVVDWDEDRECTIVKLNKAALRQGELHNNLLDFSLARD